MAQSSRMFAQNSNVETEIEAKIKHMAERSEAEALAFLLQIWTEIEAEHNMAERSEAKALKFHSESDGD